MNTLETPNYPFASFPPALRAVLWEQSLNNEGALPTIGCSLIGVLSAAIQDKVDVERMPGHRLPCCVNTLVIGGSGSRKTTVDRMLTKVCSTFEELAKEHMKPEIAAQKAKHLIWKSSLERLEKALKTLPADDEEAAEELQEELEDLLLSEPQRISTPKILYKDATQEAICKGLSSWPSAFLNSSEAGAILGSRTMSNLGFFNGLWDGDGLRVDRAASDSYAVEAPRLTLSLMVQERTFTKYLLNKGSLARDNGFLARLLPCYPAPLEGTRFGNYSTGSWMQLDAFHVRILEILMSGLPVDGVRPERKLLTLSLGAQTTLKRFSDQVETDLGSGRFLSDVKDCASKVAENSVRLAGLFHYYEGEGSQISGDTMSQAINICSWHMLEFKRLFAEAPEMPLEFQDAMALEKCLMDYSFAHPGQNWVPKKYLFTHGPNAVRKKARLDLALHVLWQQGKITLHRDNRTMLVILNPWNFPSVNQGGHFTPPPFTPPPFTPPNCSQAQTMAHQLASADYHDAYAADFANFATNS